MLCYFFPPINTSGTVRNEAFARMLPRFGWEPTVLTVDEPKDSWAVLALDAKIPEEVRVVRTGEWNVTRVVDLMDAVYDRLLGTHGARFRDIFCVPDPQLAWAPLRQAREMASEHDAIYVSASPFSSALWGAWLKNKTGKPLIADFRDPWSLNPYARHTGWHRRIAAKQERWVLERSDAVVVNTEGTRKLYMDHYPEFSRKFVWIPNGFDRLNPARHPNSRRPFRVMHFGCFYGSRNPSRLLRAMKELPELPMEFIQVGPGNGIEGQDPRVRVIPTISHAKAQKLMRYASALYLRQGEPENGAAAVSVGAKTYEYLATGLPVIAECPEGDNVDIVRRYATTSYVITDGSVGKIKSALQHAYEQHLHRTPELKDEYVEDFSRERQVHRLAQLLNRVTN
jgi:glycosyltransferase involved in cell wall biosynthesis